MTALVLCLSSLLNGAVVPKSIGIRWEGSVASFGDFYLEQLVDLARFHGVEVNFCFANSEGIKSAREWQFRGCTTPWLLMVDDDALYSPDFLLLLEEARKVLVARHPKNLGYLVGSKPDLSDRTGSIPNFSNEILGASKLEDFGAANRHWNKLECLGKYPKTVFFDTGVALMNVEVCKAAGLSFLPKTQHLSNVSGEDTLFGFQADASGLLGFFVPSAKAFHLSKPASRHSELSARVESVVREATALGVKQSTINHLGQFFPLVTPTT